MKVKTLLIAILCIAIQSVNAQNKRPLIGISSSWGDKDTRVPKTYVESVIKAGGSPVILPITDNEEVIEQQVDAIDALILTGGADLDPMLYGQDPRPELGQVTPQRDAYDMVLIRIAVQKGKPILGICRGLQGLNIAFGGTLFQDIPTTYNKDYIKHDQERDPQFGIHMINISKGSQLHDILGVDSLVVNSRHHQAIDRLAQVFTITARTSDGIIEAIENKEKKILALQFHPEDMTAAGNKQMLRIFEYLIKQAK